MTRDYKPASKQKPAGKSNAFISGLLVGLLIGIGLSVGVAVFVTDGGSAFVKRESAQPEPLPAPQGKSSGATGTSNPDANSSQDQPAANRFDFYKILPGTENQTAEQPVKPKNTEIAPQQPVAPAANETYYLQVGAFQTEEEADNIKAKLALLGLEAVIQTASVGEKGVVHRVRVGPYSDLDQIAKARTELAKNGFNADLIKTQNTVPDQ